jgi:hypothetical protein
VNKFFRGVEKIRRSNLLKLLSIITNSLSSVHFYLFVKKG